MKIRRLGNSGRFYEFDDDDCAWCAAAHRFFQRQPELCDGDTVHLENDQGHKRTVSCVDVGEDETDPIVLECEPYVFFSG